ncbi:hypothetical protein HDV03_003230 [Kappamyces sp. JEL0829]|nr:hypothetical protein HDV03_003230 [Kappamyces sp. JEL0829]
MLYTFNGRTRLDLLIGWILKHHSAKDISTLVFTEVFDLDVVKELTRQLKSHFPHSTPLLNSRSGALWHFEQQPHPDSTEWLQQLHSQAVWYRSLINGGVIVFSKFRIATMVQQPYRAGARVDYFSAKGFVHAALCIGETVLHVLATHLNASYDSKNEEQATRQCRTQQLDQLKDYIRSLPAHDPVVLVGDLNVRRDSAEHSDMLALLATSGPQWENPHTLSFDVSQNTLLQAANSTTEPMQLDYVLNLCHCASINETLAVKVPAAQAFLVRTGLLRSSTAQDYSDHYPVLGRVSW